MTARMVANLFIAGAAKSGTTQLCRLLAESDDIFLPPQKETHFFSTDFHSDLTAVSRTEYLSMYKGSREKYRIDGSVSYLYSRTAVSEICSECDDPIFLIVVRQPFDRALSHYRFNVRNGVEDRTPSEALRNNENRRRFWLYDYVEMSQYAEQLARLVNAAGSTSKIRLIDYDEFCENPVEVISRLSNFLGVTIPVTEAVNKRTNVSNEPRIQLLNKLLVVDKPWKRIIKATLPRKLRRSVKIFIHNNNISERAVPASVGADLNDVREKLQAEYATFRQNYRDLYI